MLNFISVFEEPEDPTNRSFFSEIISSISDVRFSNSGRYMISRDYLSVKVWDLNMDSKPIETYTVSILLSKNQGLIKCCTSLKSIPIFIDYIFKTNRFMSIYAVSCAAFMKMTVYLTSSSAVGMVQMELLWQVNIVLILIFQCFAIFY